MVACDCHNTDKCTGTGHNLLYYAWPLCDNMTHQHILCSLCDSNNILFLHFYKHYLLQGYVHTQNLHTAI